MSHLTEHNLQPVVCHLNFVVTFIANCKWIQCVYHD